jgi:hypothetical protein
LNSRYSTTSISVLLWSLCLVTIIPGAIVNATTWKDLYLDWPGVKIQNYFAPFGFVYLGIVMIGLIILWTGYRKRERWAWFIMLIILLCFDFPSSVLPVLLLIRDQNYQWSILLDLFAPFREQGWWHCLAIKPAFYLVGIECLDVGISIGLVRSLVMSVALLVPVKAFFWKQSAARINTESPHE